uniref:Enhancer of polycomb-like protein n=1 Tax=Globodera pallida TaxID=36090 RepID=A0A183CT39_GLOPA
ADISEENVPPEDTFNRPEFLCIDVYLACLSIPRIATCECRKTDLEKTYLKFWRRSSADRGEDEHLEMENCVVVPRQILFVRSTLDEFWDRSAVTVAMTNGQEFLVICLNGEMDVYIRDENRDWIWRKDPKRHEQNWQQFTLKYCSSIRNQQFATFDDSINRETDRQIENGGTG